MSETNNQHKFLWIRIQRETPPEHYLLKKHSNNVLQLSDLKKYLSEIKCGSIPLILAPRRGAELGESETSLT